MSNGMPIMNVLSYSRDLDPDITRETVVANCLQVLNYFKFQSGRLGSSVGDGVRERSL